MSKNDTDLATKEVTHRRGACVVAVFTQDVTTEPEA
jgi:ATP-dependent Clp protease adapter protein ClpS